MYVTKQYNLATLAKQQLRSEVRQ